MSRATMVAMAVGVFALLGAIAASAQPVIRLDTTGVSCSGLAPGGQAVLLSVAREPQGYFSRVMRREQLLSVDAQGTAWLKLDVPLKSVWVLVDLATGSWTVAVPEGFEPETLAFPTEDIELATEGVSGRFVDAREGLELFLVRPGVGAWHVAVWDGGASDADGDVDGALAVDVAAMQAIDTSPAAPESFAAGDLVIGVDPGTLAFYVHQLAQ